MYKEIYNSTNLDVEDKVKDSDLEPAEFVPFKDKKVLGKARSVHGKELEKHSNDKMKIKFIKNPHPIIIEDIFTRIKDSDDLDKKQVLILGNPEPETYIPVAELINYHRVNCRNL
jgi:glucosamine-6-phosphate deaminase